MTTPNVNELTHTESIRELLRNGRKREAICEHIAHMACEFARAERGEVINLSDLIGATEEIGAASH